MLGKKPERMLFAIMLLVVVMFTFWKLGSHPITEWDEARQGVNAIEMLERGDYVNYYFNGEPDSWNSKPPLLIWSIALSYQALGYNEFALRLPVALCMLLFFVYAYRLVRMYKGAWFALVTVLVLVSCKGVLGRHVGRTADFDGMLICWLTAFVYYTLRYLDFEEKRAIFKAGLFLGLAFLTKGTASVLLLPALFLYLLLTRRVWATLKDWRVWAGLTIFGSFVGGWLLLHSKYGTTFTGKTYGGTESSLETMFFYDTIQRLGLVNSEFVTEKGPDLDFFVTVLDTRMNVWNYVFYLGWLIGLIKLFQHFKSFGILVRRGGNQLVLLSALIVVTFILLFTFTYGKNYWYLAPVFLFVAIVAVQGIATITNYTKWAAVLFGAVVVFTLGRQAVVLHQTEEGFGTFITAHQARIEGAAEIVMINDQHQDQLLYFKWHNTNTSMQYTSPNKPGVLYYMLTAQAQHMNIIDEYEEFCLATTK